MKSLMIGTLFGVIIFFSPLSSAREVQDVNKNEKIDVDISAGVLKGYDNNVHLNADRDKDGFLNTFLNTVITYNFTDDFRLKLGNDTAYLLYYSESDVNLFDIYNEIGLEADLLDKMFTAGAGYVFDFVLFPNDDDGTYLGNEIIGFLKHRITDNIYQRINYRFLLKYFTDGKIRDAKGNRIDDLREDQRHTLEHEAGIYFSNFGIKLKNRLYRNDSNDLYFDFYDYWSYKIEPSIIVMFTEKLYAISSFSYQQRQYDDRLSTKNNETVYDETYSLSVSGLYDLTKSITIAVNYSYRENVSNEPIQKYSGSIITGGVYYSF